MFLDAHRLQQILLSANTVPPQCQLELVGALVVRLSRPSATELAACSVETRQALDRIYPALHEPTSVRALFDLSCPDCGSDADLVVEATAWWMLTGFGAHECDIAPRWGKESACRCDACGRGGTVTEFGAQGSKRQPARDTNDRRAREKPQA